MRPQDAVEAIGAIIQTVPESDRSDLFETLGQTYPELGSIAIAGAQVDVLPVDEAFRWGDVETQLTPEQKEKTELYVDALAKAFNMSKADLGLVVEETPEGAKRAVLIDTSLMGQYLGSYNVIQMNGKGWINVGGEEVNVLAGTTDAAYRAMIKDAKNRRVNNEPLPDSSANEIWTATMLTGEPLTAGGDVQFRRVYGGGVDRRVVLPDADVRVLRVRPAVVIAELL